MGTFSKTFGVCLAQQGAVLKPLLPSIKTDIVRCNSNTDIVQTSSVNLQTAGNSPVLLSVHKPERIWGRSFIRQIKFYSITSNNLISMIFYVWRLNADGTYDRIYYEDILSKINNISEIKNVTLAQDIELKEGDFLSISAKSDGTLVDVIPCASGSGLGLRYTFADLLPSVFNWDAEGSLSNIIPIHCYSLAPMIIATGDSITSGYPYHESLLDEYTDAFNPPTSWLYKLHELDARFTYQNMGRSYETTQQILSRFQNDVVDKKPVFASIQGGVNDLQTGVEKSVYLENMESMIDMCAANNIIPIVSHIMPWTNGTNEQMAERDIWKQDLINLFSSKNIKNKILIDWDIYLGTNRASGSVGNMWDIIQEYSADGIHFTPAGNARIAEGLLIEISKIFKMT